MKLDMPTSSRITSLSAYTKKASGIYEGKMTALYIPGFQCPIRTLQLLNVVINNPTLCTHHIKLYH